MEAPIVTGGRVRRPAIKLRLNNEALEELNKPSKRRKTAKKVSVRDPALAAVAEPVHISSSPPPTQPTQRSHESDAPPARLTGRSQLQDENAGENELSEAGEESDELLELLKQSDKTITLSELSYEACWKTLKPKAKDLRDIIGCQTRTIGGADDMVYFDLISWSEKKLGALNTGWEVSRCAITAYHEGMKQIDRFAIDVDDYLDYQSVVERALKWRQDGYMCQDCGAPG